MIFALVMKEPVLKMFIMNSAWLLLELRSGVGGGQRACLELVGVMTQLLHGDEAAARPLWGEHHGDARLYPVLGAQQVPHFPG